MMAEGKRMSKELIDTFNNLYHGEKYRDIYDIAFDEDNNIVINFDTVYFSPDWSVLDAMQDYVSFNAMMADLNNTYSVYAD